MITAYEAKEEMKRNLVKYNYDYEEIKKTASIIKGLAEDIEDLVIEGEKDKNSEYDFYKWRMTSYAYMTVLKRDLDRLYNELHLEFFDE